MGQCLSCFQTTQDLTLDCKKNIINTEPNSLSLKLHPIAEERHHHSPQRRKRSGISLNSPSSHKSKYIEVAHSVIY